MNVQVNGELKAIDDGTTITALLHNLHISLERVAVEVNLEILQRQEFEHRMLQDGDRVEIISFMGGGQASGFALDAGEPIFL